MIARSARDQIALHRFETHPVVEDSFVLGVSTTLVERQGDVSGRQTGDGGRSGERVCSPVRRSTMVQTRKVGTAA